jgi:hypothetical protein
MNGAVNTTDLRVTEEFRIISNQGELFSFMTNGDFRIANGATIRNLSGDDLLAGGNVDLTGYATTSYVDTAVSNLVNSAPGTLDTLNELAMALGNNPNFATTIATRLGTNEGNITTFQGSTFSGSYNDLTDKPTIPSIAGLATEAYVDSAVAAGGGSGGASVSISSTAPSSPAEGDLWYDETQARMFVWNGLSWIDAAPAGSTVGLATETYVDTAVETAVSGIINAAPGALDTLNELATALGNDANFAATIASQLATIESNITALQGSSSTLASLSNVSDSVNTSIQTGQQLQWDGTEWTKGWTQILQTSDTALNTNYGIVLKSPSATVSHAQMDAGDNFLYNPSTKTVTLEGQTITAAKIQDWDSAGGTTLANGTVGGQALVWDAGTSAWVAGTQITANNFVTTVSALTTTTLDFSKGVQTISVSAPKTFTATGTAAGKAYSLTLIITSTNGAPLTWPAGTQWPDGTAPEFDVGTHIVTLITVDNGTTFYGVALSNYS